jgi:hypothetical protein
VKAREAKVVKVEGPVADDRGDGPAPNTRDKAAALR